MRNKLVTSVSAIALLVPAVAFADMNNSGSEQTPPAESSENYTMDDLGEDAGDAVDATGRAIEEGAEDTAEAIDDAVDGETTLRTSAEVMAPGHMSADASLGTDIRGSDGETIAELYDIVVPKEGDARAILGHSGVLGVAERYTAVPFSELTKETVDGEATLTYAATVEDLEARQAFVYEQDEAEDNAEVLAATSTSLRNLDGTSVSNPAGDQIAEITDIYVDEAGKPAHAVLTSDAILGLGGKQVALDYERLSFEQGAGGPVVSLTKEQIEAAPDLNLEADASLGVQ